jgi:hypothetical protein
MQEATLSQMEDLQYSDEYAAYIMDNSAGDRVICNGDTLLEAMEDGYLFEEFAESKGLTLP